MINHEFLSPRTLFSSKKLISDSKADNYVMFTVTQLQKWKTLKIKQVTGHQFINLITPHMARFIYLENKFMHPKFMHFVYVKDLKSK